MVPLPNNQVLNGININPSNTTFTVLEEGEYRISYTINLENGISYLGSRMLLNGMAIPESIVNTTTPIVLLEKQVIQNLNAGDTISLQLFGMIAAAKLSENTPTKLTIEKID